MLLQGQNVVKNLKWEESLSFRVCLARIILPTLPPTRRVLTAEKSWMGEITKPQLSARAYGDAMKRYETVDKSRVALRVSDLELTYRNGIAYLHGLVQSCGIAPNLRSQMRLGKDEHLCFLPRIAEALSEEHPRETVIIKRFIAFDIDVYRADDTHLDALTKMQSSKVA